MSTSRHIENIFSHKIIVWGLALVFFLPVPIRLLVRVGKCSKQLLKVYCRLLVPVDVSIDVRGLDRKFLIVPSRRDKFIGYFSSRPAYRFSTDLQQLPKIYIVSIGFSIDVQLISQSILVGFKRVSTDYQ